MRSSKQADRPKRRAADPYEVHAYALRLRGVRFQANIGTSRDERAVLQEILVDVDLELPVRQLPAHDRRRDVVDYDRVATLVVEEGTSRPHRLLETYALRVVERLLAATPAERVRVAAWKARAPTKHPVDAAVVELGGERARARAARGSSAWSEARRSRRP